MMLLRPQSTQLGISLWPCAGQFVPRRGHKFWSQSWAVSSASVSFTCIFIVRSSLFGCLQGWMTFWVAWSAWSRVCLVLFLLHHKQATLAAMRRTWVSLGGESVERSASKWRRCGLLVSLVVSSWLGQLMLRGSQVTSIAVSAGRTCLCWRTECTRFCVITKEQSI